MLFDDRLATVLRNPASSEAIARAQFRQLLDLLGTLPNEARSDTVDAAYMRLGELAAAIPASERAAILEEPVLRLRSPRLVSQLALAEPAVARAATARAELAEDEWLDLIPALPVHARTVIRHRRGLGERVEALLARLGITPRGLPPAKAATAQAPHSGPKPAPRPGPQALPQTPGEQGPAIDEIGDIVRRIEAFRKTRAASDAELNRIDPTLALDDALAPPRALDVFDFATDTEGRIVWAEPAIAPAAVGLRLAARDPESPVQGSPGLLAAFRHRQPIADAVVVLQGAAVIAGEWRIEAMPRFDQPNGRFVGYLGRLRRPAPDTPSANVGEADRMRQILHELRTPVNAIQGFAEVIQQQLFGPTPHEYRALAATIVSDSARMLAGFEELERLVKLDSGAMALDAGECDLLPVIAATIAQLDGFNGPRGSGLNLDCDVPALPVALPQGEAERLLWRILATLAGATAPAEVLRLRARLREDSIRLALRLPASLAAMDGDAIFHAAASAQPQALAAGMFGTGFALRLAAIEATAAGGWLDRRGDRLRLSLPLANRIAPAQPELAPPELAPPEALSRQ
jgi:two-component system, OmpR family, sensor kinase